MWSQILGDHHLFQEYFAVIKIAFYNVMAIVAYLMKDSYYYDGIFQIIFKLSFLSKAKKENWKIKKKFT